MFPGPGQPAPAPLPGPHTAPQLSAGLPRLPGGADRSGDGADTELRGGGVEVTRAQSATNTVRVRQLSPCWSEDGAQCTV